MEKLIDKLNKNADRKTIPHPRIVDLLIIGEKMQ
jgi:hypothetical protein